MNKLIMSKYSCTRVPWLNPRGPQLTDAACSVHPAIAGGRPKDGRSAEAAAECAHREQLLHQEEGRDDERAHVKHHHHRRRRRRHRRVT